jgi:hypothetical protein
VQYGGKEANIALPLSFFQTKDKFLLAYRKEVAVCKGLGKVDEQEADPIPMSLFVFMCKWVVGKGNIFVWEWTVLQ